jgi:hypothetical protein
VLYSFGNPIKKPVKEYCLISLNLLRQPWHLPNRGYQGLSLQPPPTFNINRLKPKGRQPGALNLIKCLPLVNAAIAKTAAVTPMGAPQMPQPTSTVTRQPSRPRKNNTTTTAGTPPDRSHPQPGASHSCDDNACPGPPNRCCLALASPPATGVPNLQQKN